MTLKTYIRSIWANNPEHITRFLNEDAIFLLFWWFFVHGHKLEFYGLGHWPLYQNFIKNSNLILKLMYQVHSIFKFDIFDSFGALFSFSRHLRKLLPMNPKLVRTFDMFLLTNFLCSFTWWVSRAGLSWTYITFWMVCEEK